MFKEYLASLGLEDTEFMLFSEDELNHYLTIFWWNARKKKSKEYTTSSMETIRYSLNRALIKYGHNYGITHKNSLKYCRFGEIKSSSWRVCITHLNL